MTSFPALPPSGPGGESPPIESKKKKIKVAAEDRSIPSIAKEALAKDEASPRSLEKLRKIEEKERATETKEERITKFVSSYLHPYITGEKITAYPEPLITRLLREMDPQNKLSDEERKVIEGKAYDAYLKVAANGLYIREYFTQIENSKKNEEKSTVSNTPTPRFSLFDKKSKEFEILIGALKTAISRDFPKRDTAHLPDDAAKALQAINQQRGRDFYNEGKRLMLDAGSEEKGMLMKIRGEQMFGKSKSTEARAAPQQQKLPHEILASGINNFYEAGCTEILSNELITLLEANPFDNLTQKEDSSHDFIERVKQRLREEAKNKRPLLEKKIGLINENNLSNGIEQFAGFANAIKNHPSFQDFSEEELASTLAFTIAQIRNDKMKSS